MHSLLTHQTSCQSGLRSLYFALQALFSFQIPIVRIISGIDFIGVKMLIEEWYIIPTAYSLAFVLGIIALSVLLSVAIPEKDNKES